MTRLRASKHHIREINIDMESNDDHIEKVVDSFEKVQYDKFQYIAPHNDPNLRKNPNPNLTTNPNPNSKTINLKTDPNLSPWS